MTSHTIHAPGRFVTSPVQRGNLSEDLRGFLMEAIVPAGENATSEDAEACTHMSQSLIINVLDAYMDAAYWEGRAAGYSEHHGAVSEDAALLDHNNPQGASA